MYGNHAKRFYLVPKFKEADLHPSSTAQSISLAKAEYGVQAKPCRNLVNGNDMSFTVENYSRCSVDKAEVFPLSF